MEMVFVKPASGGRVRQPERHFTVMPEAGAWVPRDAHYERLLLSGDVLETTPPSEAPAAPAEDEQPKNSTSAGSRKPSRASEE